jgi:hypothetical protein
MPKWKFTRGRLMALPANIRPGWKGLTVANTLVNYYTTLITNVKGFIVQANQYSLILDEAENA